MSCSDAGRGDITPDGQARQRHGLCPIPSDWVRRHAAILPTAGWVLDLACGSGRHIGLLRSLGHKVIGVDQDTGLASQAWGNDACVRIVTADLETGADPFATGPLAALLRSCAGLALSETGKATPPTGLAGIVCTNYLHRPLLPRLPGLLAPGGVLIYETFAAGQERFGRPSRPEFLLQPGELLSATAALVCLAYQHGLRIAATPQAVGNSAGDGGPDPVPDQSCALIQCIVAWKPPTDWDGRQVPPLS